MTASTLPRQEQAGRDAGIGAAPEKVALSRILVALDASDHADRALAEAVALAAMQDAVITGIHAYAARLHDARFRQMEGGLPERYLEEDEMRHQRDVHDDLIGHGLGVISDSYHDVAENACREAGYAYRRLSPEGKNYRRIVEALETSDFDLLVLGAQGLGVLPGSLIGSVCERVVRRSPVDVLVIRDPGRVIGDGPIVVAIDGSARSYGALMTAIEIHRHLGVEIRAVAAYDPHYHYVAFNKIAGVLSEEAGKVFRFKEQEQLHEELIDEGIAKIYQSHLEVARKIAGEKGIDLAIELLEGKPYKAINDYLAKSGASLLMLGKTGVHADASLDIGGNAENLLRMAPCHVWLGQTTFTPPMEVVAEETIAWSREAEESLGRAPDFVRDMARKAVHRHAQEHGHTFITADIVEIVANQMMPGKQPAAEQSPLTWSDGAARLVVQVDDGATAANLRLRAEKAARRDGAETVQRAHVEAFLEDARPEDLAWQAAALARLARVPETMRDRAKARIEAVARDEGAPEVTLGMVEAGLEQARAAMNEAVAGDSEAAAPPAADDKPQFVCPFAAKPRAGAETPETAAPALTWTPEAEARMDRIPQGFMRDMTRKRVETFARRHGVDIVTSGLIDEKYAEWGAGSAKQAPTLKWEAAALARIDRIPDFVRGMVIKEVERCTQAMGLDTVSAEALERASETWHGSGDFHSEKDDEFYQPDGDS